MIFSIEFFIFYFGYVSKTDKTINANCNCNVALNVKISARDQKTEGVPGWCWMVLRIFVMIIFYFHFNIHPQV